MPRALPSPEACQYELAPGVWLDARRAVWLEREQVLAVADLHLGYWWAQRQRGQLVPVGAEDSVLSRLAALRDFYRPRGIVLLGDIVHRARQLPGLAHELKHLFEMLGSHCQLQLVSGNHDRHLGNLLAGMLLPCQLESRICVGPHVLVHGDAHNANLPAASLAAPTGSGYLIMGHEHPAISLGDGVTTSVKCPCFVAGPGLLILPAFTDWTSGSPVRPGGFMSPLARSGTATHAIAIVSGKLVPVPLAPHPGKSLGPLREQP